jgi:biotin synthase
MFRFVCPDREIRLSAGREVHLGTLQPLGLYPANALFVADYLTEPGQPAEQDWRMIEELGFEIEPLGAPLGPTGP